MSAKSASEMENEVYLSLQDGRPDESYFVKGFASSIARGIASQSHLQRMFKEAHTAAY